MVRLTRTMLAVTAGHVACVTAMNLPQASRPVVIGSGSPNTATPPR